MSQPVLLVCGRYEGIDQRALDLVVDDEVSIGDYILAGGELGANILIESSVRLIPGVLGDDESPKTESFSEGFLEYPHYTRPEEFEGMRVPSVLVSGNHHEIQRWRVEKTHEITRQKRPDLWNARNVSAHLEGSVPPGLEKETLKRAPGAIALVHHPVFNKHRDIVTTSVTNLDLHDLARISRTYGLVTGCIVTPSPAQQSMVGYMKEYWSEGKGGQRHEDRKEAMGTIGVAASIEECCLTLQKAHDRPVKLVATTAIPQGTMVSYRDMGQILRRETDVIFLLVFGTGWGLPPDVVARCDYVLEPLYGPTNYNHLPVRSAMAIITDRLWGTTP